MQNKSISRVFYSALVATFLSTSSAHATGFPTLDIAEVLNTIQSVISQAQAQIATVQETLSMVNIQQAIGDKIGGLKKFQTAKKWAEEQKAKLEKQAKRAERLIKLKQEYEQRMKQTISDVQDKYNDAKSTVEGIKNGINDTKDQIVGTVEGVKGEIEGVANNVKSQVDNAKSQINNLTGQVENTANNIQSTVNNVQNTINNTQNAKSDNVNQNVTVDAAADLWGNGSKSEVAAPSSLEKEIDRPVKQREIIQEREDTENLPQAFKTSYENYAPMSYAAMTSSFKTGTDNDGNYYFPDELALWCGINYDDDIDDEKILECFQSICRDLNAKDEQEAKENKDRFGVLVGQALSHNFSAAVSIKDKAASSKVVDDVQDTLKKSGDDMRTQVSGNGEVSSANVSMSKDELLLEAGKLEIMTIEALETYCRYYKEIEMKNEE